MLTYPKVLGERETLQAVLDGASLARYGDGEFNLCDGGHAKAQLFDRRLQDRLRGILRGAGGCLVGIPNLRRGDSPKALFWSKYARFAQVLADRPYGSSFISRPDSAPWINTPEYWQALESLWADQDVVVVKGQSAKALQASDLSRARSVREVLCPKAQAWAEYEAILERVGTPARVLICLGPTATVLAADLCARGVHAIDLGHIGLFIRKYRAGEPMTVTAADKAMV